MGHGYPQRGWDRSILFISGLGFAHLPIRVTTSLCASALFQRARPQESVASGGIHPGGMTAAACVFVSGSTLLAIGGCGGAGGNRDMTHGRASLEGLC